MFGYSPGSLYRGGFACDNTTNDPDSITLIANRNGVDDPSFVLTATKLATARYGVCGTVPAGYAAGDTIVMFAALVYGGQTAIQVFDLIVIPDPELGAILNLVGARARARASSLSALLAFGAD